MEQAQVPDYLQMHAEDTAFWENGTALGESSFYDRYAIHFDHNRFIQIRQRWQAYTAKIMTSGREGYAIMEHDHTYLAIDLKRCATK